MDPKDQKNKEKNAGDEIFSLSWLRLAVVGAVQ